MRTAHAIPAPSTSVLRFLRSQLKVQSTGHAVTPRCFAQPKLSSLQQCRTLSDIGCATSHLSPFTNNDRSPYGLQKKATIGFPSGHGPARQHLANALPSVRGFSNSSAFASSWWPHWRQKQRPSNALRPDDLPPLSRFLESDGPNLGRIIKPTSNELKLRCTEFDENGNVTLVNGEFKKSELIAKYGLLPRDLRKIDSSLLPHILVRPSAILINLLHLRCLIKSNRVLVFDVFGSTDSYTQSVFMYDLENKLRTKTREKDSLPYEFRALEAVLISVTTGLESEFEGVREPVVRVLRELEEDIDRDKLRHLLIYSKKLGTFEQKARLVRDALDELLEADDDLVDMYLTEKAAGKERTEDDHEEVELLLESYHKVCDEIVQVSGNLVSNIRNTEEIVKAILDANRNSLMLLDLKFSIGTLGLAAGTFIAALYGMNLKNFIEESDFGFFGVSLSCAFFTAIALVYGLRKLRKVQRLSMWGEGGSLAREGVGKGRGGRGSWREIDAPVGAGGQHLGGLGATVSRLDRAQKVRQWQESTWKEEQTRLSAMEQARSSALEQARSSARKAGALSPRKEWT